MTCTVEKSLNGSLLALLHALPWPASGQSNSEQSGIPAAVLIPLSLQEDGLSIVLTRRSQHVAHHKGEMCFPGGVREAWDADERATALREAWEEVGIPPESVEVVGELAAEQTRTGFTIRPVVGYIPATSPFRINPREIDEVVDVPFSALTAASNLREDAAWRDGALTRSPSYVYRGRVIHGATARILHQLVTLLADAQGKEAPWSSGTPACSR